MPMPTLRRSFLLPLVCLAFLFLPLAARAQFVTEEPGEGVRLADDQTVTRYKAGIKIRAVGGPCRGLYATVPVPTDWPEQEVRVVEDEVSEHVRRVRDRVLDSGVKQLLIEIPYLAAGEEAEAVYVFEVKRRAIKAPLDPSIFSIPRRTTRDLVQYMGNSPYIESTHPQIRSLARQAIADKESDWEKVEAIYDTAREEVEYVNGPLKGALRALRDGTGDCEELTSLFIAMCRACKIPARTVWIPGHCYAEFYLVDEEGEGHWFPCQVAGTRAFGEMIEPKPVMQKGDNFRVPEKKDRQRYAAEFLRGVPVPGGGQPKVQFIREMVN